MVRRVQVPLRARRHVQAQEHLLGRGDGAGVAARVALAPAHPAVLVQAFEQHGSELLGGIQVVGSPGHLVRLEQVEGDPGVVVVVAAGEDARPRDHLGGVPVAERVAVELPEHGVGDLPVPGQVGDVERSRQGLAEGPHRRRLASLTGPVPVQAGSAAHRVRGIERRCVGEGAGSRVLGGCQSGDRGHRRGSRRRVQRSLRRARARRPAVREAGVPGGRGGHRGLGAPARRRAVRERPAATRPPVPIPRSPLPQHVPTSRAIPGRRSPPWYRRSARW